MRPTIPLGPWRLAIDLDATRAVQALEGRPTQGCRCDACRLWAAVHTEVLPASLAAELQRVGIDPATPAELYRLDEHSTDAHTIALRVGYVAVGRILSGPAALVQHPGAGAGRLYAPLREGAEPLALAVAYQHTLAPPPAWLRVAAESLLALDLWLHVARSPARDALRAAAPLPRAAV